MCSITDIQSQRSDPVGKRRQFIDADGHVIEPDDIWENYLEPAFRSEMSFTRFKYQGNPLTCTEEIRVAGDVLPASGVAGFPTPVAKDAEYEEAARQGFPPHVYIEAMDRVGIDYMVVYPSVGLLLWAAPHLKAAAGAAYCRAYNNWVRDFCVETHGRVVGAGCLDLRDVDAAIKEARRCVEELGMKALRIQPIPVDRLPLFDRSYDPLWATVADLNVPLGIHPGAPSYETLIADYMSGTDPGVVSAQVTTAFSVGSMLASAALIMGGVLQRHPMLRVVHLECGAGWVPFWMDRLAVSVQGGNRGMDVPGLPMYPADYFRRQCYISADPDDPGIKSVIDSLGDDNIVVATDFGHPEGHRYLRAIDDLVELPGVSADSKRKIMWDNARKLYQL
jgi:uncharacterized protein